MRDHERRLSKIERAIGLHRGPAVIGVSDPTEDGELIRVNGVPITPDEFQAKYPNGILLTVVRDLTFKPKEDG